MNILIDFMLVISMCRSYKYYNIKVKSVRHLFAVCNVSMRITETELQ